jgi:hypothetical protein
MTTFERQIIGEVPLHEAAGFFIGMKQPVIREGQIKTAAARMKSEVQQIIEQLNGGVSPEGKAGRYVPVDQIKQASTTRENLGTAAGTLGGAAAGGLAGTALAARAGGFLATRNASMLKGGLPGAVAGGLVGGALMNHRMKQAMAKMGFGASSPTGAGTPEANMEGGQPTPAASNLPSMPQQPPAGASMAPPAGPIQDPEAAKPSRQQTVPVNYMGAELIAQSAQGANEVGFLRERLNAATEQNNMLSQQVQSIQSQLDEVNQTQQAAGDQIMEATNEAVASSTRAMQTTMQAANMRIGIQKMREAMMELASQDPESMGTLSQQQAVQEDAATQQPMGQPGQAAVNAGAGTPEQTGTQPTQPGAPAAGAKEEGGGSESGGDDSATAEKAPQVQIKTGGAAGWAIPGAVAGAGLAAMQSNRMSKGVPEAQGKVDELEEAQEGGGSFGQALDLAKAKTQLANNEVAAKHPIAHGASSALKGAMGGAVIGSALHHLTGTIKQQGMMPAGLLR